MYGRIKRYNISIIQSLIFSADSHLCFKPNSHDKYSLGSYRSVNLYHEVGNASLKSRSWFRYLCAILGNMLFFTIFCKTFGLLVRQPEEFQTYFKGTNRCQREDCSNKDREISYILTKNVNLFLSNLFIIERLSASL